MSGTLISSRWLSTDATFAHSQDNSPSYSKSIALNPSVRHSSPIYVLPPSSPPPTSARFRTSQNVDVSCRHDKYMMPSKPSSSCSLAKMGTGNSDDSLTSTSKNEIKSTTASAPVIVQYMEERSESPAQEYARNVRTQWRSADLAGSGMVPRTIPLRGSASADLMRLSSLPDLSQEAPRSSSMHFPERKHRPHRKSTKVPNERKRSTSPPRRHVYTSFPIQQHVYSLYPQFDEDGGSEEEGRGICRESCCTSASVYDKRNSSSRLDIETLWSSTRKSAKKSTRRKRTHHHHSTSHLESTNLDGLVQDLQRVNIHGSSYLPRPYSSESVREKVCSCEEEVQEEVEIMSFVVSVTPTEALAHCDGLLSRSSTFTPQQPPKAAPQQRPLSYSSSI